ncbi:unnamed protein product [Fraxinus pennsylvanica]|uniref:Uncharacterized protein n=1 Tax=Fraxinus pennsylvanica TaxID=56036 RepID=A0AAD2AAG5_9LAMI|nr:unnamed protein product [Fraxinus pennsylvanica]
MMSDAKPFKEFMRQIMDSPNENQQKILSKEAIDKVKLNTRRLIRRQRKRLSRLQMLFGWNIHYVDVTGCLLVLRTIYGLWMWLNRHYKLSNLSLRKKRIKMHSLKKIYILQFLLLLLSISFSKSISQETPERYGDSIRSLLTPCSVLNSTTCFDNIPDHVPNPCNECNKPDGHCGAGLRCICHPKECKDTVISVDAVLKPCWNIVFFLLFFLILKNYFQAF